MTAPEEPGFSAVPTPSGGQGASPRRFRPRLGMTLAALAVFAVLVTLGTWQWQRHVWKSDLIQRIETRIQGDPAPLPGSFDQPDDWDYRPVSVTGTFLHEREMHLGPRTMAAPGGMNQTGVHVLTPLVRSDGRGTVLVDRGFVPDARRTPTTRADGLPEGEVTVTGVARLVPAEPGWMQPANRPMENFWFWIDLPAMARAAQLDDLAPVIIQADATPNPGGYPVGGRTVVNLPNNHLSYVGTWYGLALTLVAVWIAASFRRSPPR